MSRFILATLTVPVFALALCIAPLAEAGTIIKLGLGGDSGADVQFDGTTLSTIDDGDAATVGNQNTNVEFLDFLSSVGDISSPPASFTMSGLTAAGAPTIQGGVVVLQNFSGGTLSLWDDTNALLLSATLSNSLLVGPIGPPATGALFTTTFGTVTGGSLASQIIPGSLSLSMSLTDVNGGGGFAVSGAVAPALSPFSADVTLNIAAEEIPEPASALLVLMASLTALVTFRRARA